jgi:predicted secreted acid phosphatase
VAGAEGYLAWAIHHQHGKGKGKPAVVFDIDDTLLSTYDYEIANQGRDMMVGRFAELLGLST